MMSLRIPLPSEQRLLWYRITKVLGHGRSGFTYLAHDRSLERRVVIKECLPEGLAMRAEGSFVSPQRGRDDTLFFDALNAFLAAAQQLATAKGPHLAEVLNAFEANGTGYVVTRHEEAPDFERLALTGPVPEGRLLAIAEALLSALERLHGVGAIHGDVKPANILIGPEQQPLLVGFGSASPRAAEVASTALETRYPPYAPFELCYGERELLGPWSDIYGLAGALYLAVNREPPTHALVRSRAILQGAPDPLEPASRLAGGAYSAELLKAIDHGLGFTPTQRPLAVAAWREQLRSAMASPERKGIPQPRERGPDPGSAALGVTVYRDRDPVVPAGPRRVGARHFSLAGALAAGIAAGALLLPTPLLNEPRIPVREPRSTPTPAAAGRTPRTEAVRLPDHEGARQRERRDAERLIDRARASAALGSWQEAEAYLDEAARLTPDAQALAGERAALRERWIAAERGRVIAAERRAGERRLFEKLVKLARTALDRADWGGAEAYLAEAASIEGRAEEELSRVREALVAGKASEARRAAEARRARERARQREDLAARRPPEIAERSAVPATARPDQAGARGGAVEILQAAPTQMLARPGETVEFLTRFRLDALEDRADTYVEATWVLHKDGRRLGQPGVSQVFAKTGIRTLSTALTLPPRMTAGRYTVEHRVRTEGGEDSARSHFSVVSP